MNSIAVNEVNEVKTNEVKQCSIFNGVEVQNRFFSYLDVSAITLKAYRTGVKQFISYMQLNCEKMPSRKTVINFKQSLIANGAKPSTVSLYLSAIRRFFGWLETEGLYEDITRGIKSPRMEKGHKRDALSANQLKNCIQNMSRNDEKGLRDKAMFLLMSTCGLRTVEITRANVEDLVDLQGVPVLFVQGKGRSDRKEFVKLSAPVYSLICEYLSARGQVSGNEPLFVSTARRNRGHRLTTMTVSSVAKSAMKKAGYNSPRLTAHSLRHSAATLAIQAGMSLPDVQAFMRHSSINVTMIYNHSINRLNSQCENAVTAAIFAA